VVISSSANVIPEVEDGAGSQKVDELARFRFRLAPPVPAWTLTSRGAAVRTTVSDYQKRSLTYVSNIS